MRFQQQLGHATLSLTTDLYGRWLRAHATRGGVEALEEALPARGGAVEVVARGAAETAAPSPRLAWVANRVAGGVRRLVSSGAADRIRTGDVQLGKSLDPRALVSWSILFALLARTTEER